MDYQHIFFDLDHTLWDFERASEETLTDLYHQYQLEERGAVLQDFLTVFSRVNAALWARYNVGKINRDEIREQRFKKIFEQISVEASDLTSDISRDYLHVCPTKSYVLPNSFELLQYLAPNYRLHILTNGFEDVQHTKLKASGLHQFFDVVVTSDHTGFKKPDPKIFEYALDKAQAKVKQSMMIGDGLDTDIIGAQNVAMDHVFYNQRGKRHGLHVTHEVSCLSEIKKIL